jgi:hypothetical protein
VLPCWYCPTSKPGNPRIEQSRSAPFPTGFPFSVSSLFSASAVQSSWNPLLPTKSRAGESSPARSLFFIPSLVNSWSQWFPGRTAERYSIFSFGSNGLPLLRSALCRGSQFFLQLPPRSILVSLHPASDTSVKTWGLKGLAESYQGDILFGFILTIYQSIYQPGLHL